MGIFTPEERSLVCLFDITHRTQLINDMKETVAFVIYPEEIKLLRTVIDKLEHMTDGEYVDLGIFPSDMVCIQ